MFGERKLEKVEKFKLFWGGEYSQWHMARIYDPKFDMTFNCCEQYMMYCKALLFKNGDWAQRIMESTNPREQKKMGRQITGFNKEAWEEVALNVVQRGNYLKFMQNRTLLEMMMNDVKEGYTTFVEASPFDKIWGIGLGEDDPDCLDRNKWKGLNWLGIAITNVKDAIIEELM